MPGYFRKMLMEAMAFSRRLQLQRVRWQSVIISGMLFSAAVLWHCRSRNTLDYAYLPHGIGMSGSQHFTGGIALGSAGGLVFIGTYPYTGSSLSEDLDGRTPSLSEWFTARPDRKEVLDRWSMFYDSQPHPPAVPSYSFSQLWLWPLCFLPLLWARGT